MPPEPFFFFFFTQSTTLHEKLNHCAPTHSRGKPLILVHFVLMQRDSSVLYSYALFLTNRPQALHSQLLRAQALWSKNVSTFSEFRFFKFFVLLIPLKIDSE